MEISKVEDNGNVIKEVSSSLSKSSSEFEKDVGSAHVIQKSSSMEAEECSRMISQSSSDVKDTEMKEETEVSGEIKQEELKLTLQEIISEIEESVNGKEGFSKEHEKEECETFPTEELPDLEKREEIIEATPEENETSFQKELFYKVDRQTSTTSLEDQHAESTAASLLGLLSRGDVGKRPHSLPANLAHLWQSLKIANELNQSLAAANSALNGDDSEAVNTVVIHSKYYEKKISESQVPSTTIGQYSEINSSLKKTLKVHPRSRKRDLSRRYYKNPQNKTGYKK